MVEATQRRILLEPVQATQPRDIIVFQNGVLNLKEVDPVTAWTPDPDAPLKYSHAVWTYFDAELWKWAFQNGIGNIATENHFYKLWEFCGVSCPIFRNFMDQWFPDDKAVIEVIMRWFGYSMTTDTSEQKFVFFYGPTRAGKGSLARLLCGIVGSNNYSVANYSAFSDKFQAMGMHDRLVVTMEEVEATPKEHEKRLGMLKKYLGGERIVWEQKYERSFEDEFIGKIIMQSNEVLAYEDKGRSITARMIPMEFTESFFGSGAEPPERVIFQAGEANTISTIAAMAWYRMKRNRVKGAFDFNDEHWSIKKSRSCRLGEGSLLLESHKIAFKYLLYLSEKETEKDSTYKLIKKRKLIICTRNRLKDLTELMLDYIGKKHIINLSRILKDAILRDYPKAVETCFKINGVGRCRGWKGLYIDVRRLQDEYPELFDNETEIDERVRSICG